MPRVFEVVTKENYLDEDKIKSALKHKTIKEWTYSLHDEDEYLPEDEKKQIKELKAFWADNRALIDISEEEYIKQGLTHKAGTHKDNHWHVAMRTDRNEEVETIARWFGVEPNFVKIWKGRGGFLDAVEYQTHESESQQALGKHLYSDDKLHANFDFRAQLNKRLEMQMKYGKKDLNPKEELKMHVLHDGWSMRRCRVEDPLTYADIRSQLPPLRLDYLADQPPVGLRITIYVDGNSGLGKSSFCRAIAETLFSDCEHPYFSIGNDERVTFDGYDGEPCIIWNDMRVTDFITRFSPQGTYKIFDTHPDKEAQQAKHTRVILTNSVNIINGVQPYEEFIRGLAGTYKDKAGNQYKAEDETQAWRRFPMILCIREDDFDILLNQGFVNNDLYSVQQMILYNHVRGSMKKAMEQLGGEAKQIAVGTMTKPVADAYHFIEEKHENKITNPDEMPEEFLHYGETISSEEREAAIVKNKDELHSEYEEWLDNWFMKHDSLRGTDNHPQYDWWLEHIKHISSKRILI